MCCAVPVCIVFVSILHSAQAHLVPVLQPVCCVLSVMWCMHWGLRCMRTCGTPHMWVCGLAWPEARWWSFPLLGAPAQPPPQQHRPNVWLQAVVVVLKKSERKRLPSPTRHTSAPPWPTNGQVHHAAFMAAPTQCTVRCRSDLQHQRWAGVQATEQLHHHLPTNTHAVVRQRMMRHQCLKMFADEACRHFYTPWHGTAHVTPGTPQPT